MIERFFKLREHGTNARTEVIAGLTTFMTMAYIVAVNPAILEAAGIPKGPSMVATIISAFFGTLLMGVYAKRPFAIAPYMGENAFVAYTVVKVLGYSWETALGAIFMAHGAQKLFGAFGGNGMTGTVGMIEFLGVGPPLFWAWVVALVEFFGGLAILLGFLTRVAAVLIIITMVGGWSICPVSI